jgi:hypothetical protein
LNGKTPKNVIISEVLNSSFGSKLDNHEGIGCRTFYVETQYVVTASDTTEILFKDVCIDLNSYYPVRWLHRFQQVENGIVTYELEVVDFDLRFNVPIDELVLPSQ